MVDLTSRTALVSGPARAVNMSHEFGAAGKAEQQKPKKHTSLNKAANTKVTQAGTKLTELRCLMTELNEGKLGKQLLDSYIHPQSP